MIAHEHASEQHSSAGWSPNRTSHQRSSAYYTLYTPSRVEAHDGDIYAKNSPTRLFRCHSYATRIVQLDDDDSLTVPRPQLRRKRDLNSLSRPTGTATTSGMRNTFGISKTTSVPSFTHLAQPHLRSDHEVRVRPSSSPSVDPPPNPLHRTSSNSLTRSPSSKRPPASHSSYGVETFCGPPPSYSTQRTLSQDRIVRLDRNASAAPPPAPAPAPNLSSNINTSQRSTSPTKTRRDSSPSRRDRAPSPLKIHESVQELVPQTRLASVTLNAVLSSTESSFTDLSSNGARTADTPITLSPSTPDILTANRMATTATYPSVQEKENEEPRMLRTQALEEDGKGSSSDEKKSEDLFLNIAKTDAPRSTSQATSRLDKRRSRGSLPFFSNPRPSTAHEPSPTTDRFDTTSVSGRSHALNYYSKRSSLGQHVPGAFSRTVPHDSGIRESRLETQSSHPAESSRRISGRRFSIANSATNSNAEAPRTNSRPNTARTNRLISESTFVERPKMPESRATESTISTTAPSTVWDELDDLKSRIRNLERTGKLPPSSAAAMTSAERPKTATTAATTMSSSPKHKPAAPPQLQSAIEGIPSNIHPNLHEALGNAKAVLTNEVYQKLQATAQDALQLSMMLNLDGNAVGSTIGGPALSERQLRRRTESMCRSLTELAISLLSEPKPLSQPATRPASRDAYQSFSGLRSRRYSNEPNDRPPVTSRVHSRLETRRASTAGMTPNTPTTPHQTYQTSPTALPQLPASASSSRIGRTPSSLIRSRLTPGYTADGATDDETQSPSVRPISRAMTEVGTLRSRTRNGAEFSRDYTAQHPLPPPATTDVSAAPKSQLPMHLVPRRKYGTSPSVVGNAGNQTTPVTPKEPWGRISIVPATMSSPVEAPPEALPSPRPASTRRSLGFTSRISSVSSRLRAAKVERNITPSSPYLETPPLERHGSGQTMGS